MNGWGHAGYCLPRSQFEIKDQERDGRRALSHNRDNNHTYTRRKCPTQPPAQGDTASFAHFRFVDEILVFEIV